MCFMFHCGTYWWCRLFKYHIVMLGFELWYWKFCIVCVLYVYTLPSNRWLSRTLVGNKILDHSDVVGTSSPVCAAPTTSLFSTWHLTSMEWAKTTARWDEKYLSFGIWCGLYQRFDSTLYLFMPLCVKYSWRQYDIETLSASLGFCDENTLITIWFPSQDTSNEELCCWPE